MFSHYKKILWFLILTALNACSWMNDSNNVIANRDTDYLSAKSIPPLKIPPGLSSASMNAHFPVSEKNYPESAKKVSLVPPELNSKP